MSLEELNPSRKINDHDTDSTIFTKTNPPKIGDVPNVKQYVDEQVTLITETGIPKLNRVPLPLVVATENGQKEFNIDMDTFDTLTDHIEVHKGHLHLHEGADFTISGKKVILEEGVPVNTTISMIVLKNVPLGDDGSVSGTVIAPNSLPLNRLEKMPTASDVGAMHIPTFISSDTDLDTITKVGFYFGTGMGTTENHRPVATHGFALLVEKHGGWNGMPVQTFTDFEKLRTFKRAQKYDSTNKVNVWQDWKDISGDFKSDGSVPMTGSLKTSGEFQATNGYNQFGGNNEVTVIGSYKTIGDTTGRRWLGLWNESLQKECALKIGESNGASYNIYGEHNITKGTASLEAGTSALGKGCIYLQYE